MTDTRRKTGIGARVARYRKAAGFKDAAALAATIPGGLVTKGAIVNIEAGRKADPSVTEIIAIAVAVGVSPLSLIVDTEQPFTDTDHPGFPVGTVNYVAARWVSLEWPLDDRPGLVQYDRAAQIHKYAGSLFDLENRLRRTRIQLAATDDAGHAVELKEVISAAEALFDATVSALKGLEVDVPDGVIALRDSNG